MNKRLFSTIVTFIFIVQVTTFNNTTVIVTDSKNYSTIEPVWLTSNFFRAGNELVISSFTGSSQFPFASYTFTFSSALPGMPELAYGIQKYRGNDYLMQQFYEIRKTGLTSSTFTVEVQIFGYTNLWILAVAYLAVDPTFPHHYNSFDNVPINYTAGNIVNISTKTTSGLTYYTNYINYTQQAAGRTFTSFASPLSGNKIVLFMTSLWIQGTNPYPIKFHIYPQVISSQVYMWNITLEINVLITNVHFSEIIFNSDDVQSSQRYYIVYDKWYTDINGGFLTIPVEFVDNFMMGVTAFETTISRCGFEVQWIYTNKTVGGVSTFGIQMLYSWTLTNTCGFSWLQSSLLYMMTWRCDPPYNYFNLTTRQCQTQCGAFTVENPSNYTCLPCNNNTCYQCTDPSSTVCDTCASYMFRQLIAGECVCMSGYFQLNSLCQSCDSANPGCLNCTYDDGAGGTLPYNSSYFICLECNTTTYSLTDAQTCIICLVPGCTTCSASSGSKCITCDITSGYYLNSSTDQCDSICGDSLIATPFQNCDDNNTVNNDGCSSTCQIQAAFSCSGSPSICYFDSNATLTLNSQVMENNSVICNTITFQISLTPVSSIYDSPDIVWDNFLSTPNSSIIMQTTSLTNYSAGILTVSFFLLTDIQNSTLILQTNFSTLLPNSYIFSNTSAPPLIFMVNTSPEALMTCCDGFYYDSILGGCQQICGDGIVYLLPCDDGNLVDGDGCSSACQIQNNYSCSATSPSVCTYNGSTSISLKTGDKDPNSNSMTLLYDFGASYALVALNNGSTDITSMVKFPRNSGVTVKSAYIDPITQELKVQIQYTQDLQDLLLQIQITPPIGTHAFSTANMTNSWKVNPTNQLKAITYSTGQYQTLSLILIIADGILAAYLTLSFITMVYRRFIGLQLASLIQFGYLSLLQNKEITVYSWPIANWKYVFGYNSQYFSEIPSDRFMFPHNLYDYQPNFGFSNNFMLILASIIFFIALLFLIVSTMTQKGTNTRVRYVASLIVTELGYTLVIFLSPNIITAICIQFNEGILFTWDLLWSKIFLIISVALIVIANFVNTKMAQNTIDVGTFLKQKIKSSIHMPVIFNIRLALFSVLLFAYHISTTVPSYMTIAIQISYIIYVVLCRPHLRKVDFVRSICVQMGLLWILTMRLVEINILSEKEDSNSKWFPALAYIQYAIYLLCIIVSMISLFYHCCRPSDSDKSKINHELFESKEKFDSSLQGVSVNGSHTEITNQFATTQSMQQTIKAQVTRTYKIIDNKYHMNRRTRKFRAHQE